MTLLAVPIVLYSLRYSVLGQRAYAPGFTESFSRHPWLVWIHTTAGPIALAAGPLQFLPAIRARWPMWHRRIGTTYVVAAALLAAAGLDMALVS